MGDTEQKDGADGLAFWEIPDQLPLRTRQRNEFINQNRLIQWQNVPSRFGWFDESNGFSLEEELHYAVLFKMFPKNFLEISNRLGRSRAECRNHYYKYKHDGRFETETLEERPGKELSTLPPDDRRQPGNFDDNLQNNDGGRGKRKAAKIINRVPIDVEIERLQALVPDGVNLYRDQLLAASDARTTRLAAAEETEREAEEEAANAAKAKKAEAKKRSARDVEKGKGKARAAAAAVELQTAKSFDATALFNRLNESLQNMRQGIADILAKYEIAAFQYFENADNQPDEIDNLRQDYEAHKNRVILIGKMLRALLDDTLEMNREFDKEFAKASEPKLLIDLCLALISAKTGIVQLKRDWESLRTQLPQTTRVSARRCSRNVQALQDSFEEREDQVVKLQSLVEQLLDFMEDELEEAEGQE